MEDRNTMVIASHGKKGPAPVLQQTSRALAAESACCDSKSLLPKADYAALATVDFTQGFLCLIVVHLQPSSEYLSICVVSIIQSYT